ncbi:MAG: hypothetical protein IKR59_08075 [Lachnospiraceae bacterium]|nr:hypothetical protein [Lachnospiraceae bacterium]
MIRIFKCPNCGGSLHYHPGTDEMICPNCRTTQPISEVNQKAADGKPTGFTGQESYDNSGSGAAESSCPACGGPLKTDEHTASTFCPYCKSPTLIESRFDGVYRPSRVLPFQFDKKEAQNMFKTWKGTGLLTPNKFKSAATMDKVTGVYVPYWLYSYTGNVNMIGEGLNMRVMRQGDDEIIETDHYEINRVVQEAYENVPADASEKFPDENMHVLEPFDFTKLRNFTLPYMSGFTADTFDYSATDLNEKVRSQVEQDMINDARQTITEYEAVNLASANVNYTQQRAEYVYLPIWTLIFEYMGKKYPLYMNGESGEIDGVVPYSKLKAFAIFAVAFAVFFLIAFLLGRVF